MISLAATRCGLPMRWPGAISSSLRPADIAGLACACNVRRLPAGTLVLTAGDTVETIHIVRHGEVHLTTRRSLGGRQLVGLVRVGGGVIGDIQLFCDQPMPFDVVTGMRSTIIDLRRERLVSLLQRSPTLSLRSTVSVAERLDQAERRLVTLLTKNLTGQVASLLLEERERNPNGEWIVRLAHRTLAELLGARRQSVSRVISGLRAEGLITCGYRRLVLHDLPKLAERAGVAFDSPEHGAGGRTLDGHPAAEPWHFPGGSGGFRH
ncbi:MAG: Crp/Fnr family transcriptional regulator [Egibacteraceae bacterium]